MSVLVPDHEIFNHLYNAMVHSAISTTVDSRYSYVMSRHMNNHTDKHEEAARLCREWLRLIEKSYNIRYKEKGGYTYHLLKPVSVPFQPVQVLKYAQCVSYNIEIFRRNKDYKLLVAWINDIKGAIIGAMPEYKDAKWSEI